MLDILPFRFLRNLGRSREIAAVLLTYGYGDMVDRLRLRRYLQLWRRLCFWRKREPEIPLTRAERVRLALQDLGATFIKFGQVVSTRPDLVPPDVIVELSKLQENVPIFSSAAAMAILRTELGMPVEDAFAVFEAVPIAAGSLGQVHRARHHNGTWLAVKIRRPNVVRDIERDLSLMMEMAQLIEKHIPESEIFDPVGLVNHFARTIRRELNFRREGRTLDEFSRLFRNDATLFVPKVFWDLTTESVLTMEFINGYRISDPEAFKCVMATPQQVARNGALIFMKMAFELGVFHGDPHPGNIRLLRDGSICLLDYGMIGSLDDEKRELLVDLFVAVGRKDIGAAVTVVQKIGQPFRPIDPPLLRADIRDFVESYYGVPLERLNVGTMLTDFVNILSNHGIRCPGDLMLLIRALITLEGVGRELDPNFNLAALLAPFVEQVVRERYSARRIASKMQDELKLFSQLAHDVPIDIARIIERISRDDLRVQLEHRGLDVLINELDRSGNRVVIGLLVSSLIVASALIIQGGNNIFWISGPIFVLSSLLGSWLIYGIFRSGRL